VDHHNQSFSFGASRQIVRIANQSYTSMGVEHDPRYCPVGRQVSARLGRLGDGDWGGFAEWEVFEKGDPLPRFDRSKKLAEMRNLRELRKYHLNLDSGFASDEDREAIKEIAEALSIEPKEEIKRRSGLLASSGLAWGCGGFSTSLPVRR
jgi:hypothetical protein